MQFLILGNGIAGITAAYTIRSYNKNADITIVSQEPYPAYSACVLSDYLCDEISRERIFVREFKDYMRQNILLILGKKCTALDINRKRLILQTESISYDKLIIATGSETIELPIYGIEKKGVFRFKSLEDVDRIYEWAGQRAVVIGSGPIGVEISLAMKKKGYEVFLLEFLGSVLPRVFEAYPASMIQDLLQRMGIEVLTGEKVTEILGANRVEGVSTNRRKVSCDTVIVATGVKPAVGFLEGVLDFGKLGGIITNECMRTSVPDIYACGDCVETKSMVTGRSVLSLLWHNARTQGNIAGSNAVGIHRTYPGSVNITAIDLFGTHVFSGGIIGADVAQGLEIVEKKRGSCYQRLILLDGVLVGVQSINWSENIGHLLSAICRKEKQKRPEDLFAWRKTPAKYPRFF